jgi:hypothetical protein
MIASKLILKWEELINEVKTFISTLTLCCRSFNAMPSFNRSIQKKWGNSTDKFEEEVVEISAIESKEMPMEDLYELASEYPFPERMEQLESDHKKVLQNKEEE